MKIIFLIISGCDNSQFSNLEIYKSLLELSSLYYDKIKEKYDFKYFFCEYNNLITENIVEVDNFIYIKGVEGFDKIYEKTIKSIEYINKKYEYNFLIRTNISSFWNIHNMFNLSNKLPITGCLSGIYIFNDFITGTGIIMSKDVCEVLINEPFHYGPGDDVAISNNLKKYFNIFPLKDNLMFYLINDDSNIPDDINNILYFRIKNNDRKLDIALFKLLLKKIYNI